MFYRTHPLLLSFLILAASPQFLDADILMGTGAYLSFADSPYSSASFGYFHLENFEDSLANTPGLSVSGGFFADSGPNRDSVDADDGLIDGSGSGGVSYANQTSFASVSVNFNEADLGSLPTAVGLVWTDGGVDSSGNPVSFTFEAFDGSNNLLDSLTITLGDGNITGQTAEDRFFGISDSAGVAQIRFRSLSSNSRTFLEIDHVQYGLIAIPEPSTILILGLLTGGILFRRERPAVY